MEAGLLLAAQVAEAAGKVGPGQVYPSGNPHYPEGLLLKHFLSSS